MRLNTTLQWKLKDDLVKLLYIRIQTFFEYSEDVTGVDPKVMTRKININPFFRPVQKKKRKLVSKRHKIIKTEIDKSLSTGLIKEV